jgi:pimeloyl-ACP methyl ester carboxylesterase
MYPRAAHALTGTLAVRVSVDSSGTEASGKSSLPVISADGRFVSFQSRADNLESNANRNGDNNGVEDVFRHDLMTGVTIRVSVPSNTEEANGASNAPSISADGQVVAFSSVADNLVSGDSNLSEDIFIYEAGAITRVSVSSTGEQANGNSTVPSISADGQVVLFHSNATNLSGGLKGFFVHDRQTGTTELVSVTSDGTPANGQSRDGKISGDGRYVVFSSMATNLVPGDTNGVEDIFFHDRYYKSTVRLNMSVAGFEADSPARYPTINYNGSVVAFATAATNLAGIPFNNNADIFVIDVVAGNLMRIANNDPFGIFLRPTLSGDGRFVAFSAGDDLEISVYDLLTGTAESLHLIDDGLVPDAGSYRPAFSADARYVAIESAATNLVENDTNNSADIFIAKPRNRAPQIQLAGEEPIAVVQQQSFSDPGATATDPEEGDISSRMQITGTVDTGVVGTYSIHYEVSDTQRLTAQAQRDVIVAEPLPTDLPDRISLRDDSSSTTAASWRPALSADGRFVAFESWDVGLAAGSEVPGIYLRDRLTRQTWRVSGPGPSIGSSQPSISGNGRWVSFITRSQLAPGDLDNLADVYLYDRIEGQHILASRGGGPVGTVTEQSLSNDGCCVAFESGAQLVQEDIDDIHDFYLFEVNTGVMRRIGQGGGNPAEHAVATNSDGSLVAFSSSHPNGVVEDHNGRKDIFLYNRITGTTELVSRATDGTIGNGDSFSPSLSADGNYVTFFSDATNLVDQDNNGFTDIFLHSRQSGNGTTSRVNISTANVEANGESIKPVSMSHDGRFIVFCSEASNLVENDTNGIRDVFMRDRVTRLTTRVNLAPDGSEVTSISTYPAISGSGNVIAYSSPANDILPGDTNTITDVFVVNNHWLWTLRVGIEGIGTVSIDPPGENCGYLCAVYPNDEEVDVTLYATSHAYSGYEFSSWDNAPGCTNSVCTLTLTDTTAVVARFVRKTYPVTGRVVNQDYQPLAGVAIHVRPGDLDDGNIGEAMAVSDADGNYSLSLSSQLWAVTPQFAGYTFPQITVLVDPPGESGFDFLGRKHQIVTGRFLNCSGQPVPSIQVRSNNNNVTAVTDAQGYYSLVFQSRGNYRIYYESNDHAFEPNQYNMYVGSDLTGIDFRGGLLQDEVSGSVRRIVGENKKAFQKIGPAIEGAKITPNCGPSTVSSVTGAYVLPVVQGANTVTVSKEGFTFGAPTRGISDHNFLGTDRPPVVLVHGWVGSPDGFKMYNNNIPNGLEEGLYAVGYARLHTTFEYTPQMEENVLPLMDAIDGVLAATGQPKAIVIAHSMGGLVSRAYVEGAQYRGDVSELFTLGTPHDGTPLAVFGKIINNPLKRGGPGVQQMAHDLDYFNMRYQRRTGVRYHAIGGNVPETITRRNCLSNICSPWCCWHETRPTWEVDWNVRNFLGHETGKIIRGPDDGFVSTKSAMDLSGWVDRAETNEVHTLAFGEYWYLNHSSAFSHTWEQCLKPVLVDRTRQSCGTLSYNRGDFLIRGAVASPQSTYASKLTPTRRGSILAGEQIVLTLPSEGSPVTFGLMTAAGGISMTLVDPDGQTYTAESMAEYPQSMTYHEGPTEVIFGFKSPLPGEWQAVLVADPTLPYGETQYTLVTVAYSDIGLSATADQHSYAAGEVVTISAVISAELNQAAVEAEVFHPNGNVETVPMTADGDQSYSGTFGAAAIAGFATVTVNVVGLLDNGGIVERTQDLGVVIRTASLSLTGSFIETAPPNPLSPILLEGVEIAVGVDASTITGAWLSGDLVSNAGVTVAHTTTSADALVGSNSITLFFPAADIVASGAPGPYTLTNLLLYEQTDQPMLADEATNAWVTSAYELTSFAPQPDRPVVTLPGPHSVFEGGTITIEAEATDPEEEQLSFEWQLEGDGSLVGFGSSAQFSAEGLSGPRQAPTVVSLRVTDPHGYFATTETTVDVRNANPTIVMPDDAELRLGEYFTANGFATDSGGDALSGEVDYGDGSGPTPLSVSDGGFILDYLYTNAGEYVVRVTITDKDGGQVTGTAVMTVLASRENLAIGKPTIQSSNQFATTGAEAVDGNRDGDWNSGSLSCTDHQPQPYWQVDLQVQSTINEIILYNRTDCCGERLSDFDVMLSTDGENWSSWYVAGGGGDHETVTLDGVVGRYVRIQLRGTNFLTLAEVEVYGLPNLAFGQLVVQSTNQFAKTGAEAVDGNRDGDWNNGSVSCTDHEPQAYWEVDLGGIALIESIKLFNRTDCCTERLSDFDLRISEDGITWSDIHHSGAIGVITTLAPPAPMGRYVRIQLRGVNFLSLAEVEVFGSFIPLEE